MAVESPSNGEAMKIARALLIALLVSAWPMSYTMAEERQVISATRWAAIRAALAEAQKTDRRLIEDMDKYEIWLSNRDGTIVVSFVDSEDFATKIDKPGAKGKQAHFVGFTVHLDKKTLQVVRSGFAK